MKAVAGVDLGGTAINYTIVNAQEQFLIKGLCEHPAHSTQGPEVCLRQIEDGLKMAVEKAGVRLDDVVAVGLDTPGPADLHGQPGHRSRRIATRRCRARQHLLAAPGLAHAMGRRSRRRRAPPA